MRRACAILLMALAACTGAPRSAAVEPPRGEPTSVRPGVNARYYDAGSLGLWIDRFEGERREVVEFRGQILDALALEPGMTVADVGAGTDLYFEHIAAAVGPDGTVYATDIVPVFLERLRARKADAGLDQIEIVAATPLDPGLPARAVDVVFLCDVYHHVEYPHEYMRALLEALRPGGQLIVVDFQRIEGVTSAGMLKHVRSSKQTVIEELRAAGFEFVEEVDLGMRENYFLRLRRPPAIDRPSP